MKHLGLDLGSKTVGMALSDPFGMLARVHKTLRFPEDQYDVAIADVLKVIEEEQVQKVVLGFPKHMNNDVGVRGQISEQFKAALEAKTPVTVVLWDERLTSRSVNRVMLEANVSRQKRKDKKDELAAVVILQNYLDSNQ